MKRILLLSVAMALLVLTTWAQRVISGKVTDDKGEGLPGVNVIIKGTSTGVTTDIDGNFQITLADDDAILVFSSIGMQPQEITVGARTTLDISMDISETELDELIVVGYGTQSKRNMTDNVARVSSDQMAGIPTPSFQNTLAGKAAGVRVTQTNGKLESGISISVRGQSSITASSQPLYVLDGVPLINANESNNGSPVNPLLTIPASDIESIEVLKDASAAAIYGARGGNGVVIITTKRGKEGKAQFSLNVSSGISRITNSVDWMNSEQYIDHFTEAARNSDALYGIDSDNDPDSYLQAEAIPTFDYISNGTWESADRYDTDWEDYAFQDGFVRDVDFSVSGGNGNTNYFFGAAINDSKGIIRGNALQRMSGRANISQKVNERFTMGMNFNFSRAEIDRIANDNAFTTPLQAIAQAPISPAFVDGEPFADTFYPNFLLQDKYGSYKTIVNRILGKLNGEVKINDFIKLSSDLSYDIVNQTEDSWDGSKVPFQSTNGEAYASNVLSTNYNFANYATFDKSFGDHGLNLIVGTEYNQGNRRFTSVTAIEFPSDDLQTVDSGAEITAGSGNLTAYSFVGYFARASYSYKDKYLLKASIRRDGSSRFGSETRFGTFPAVSAGWIISEEAFLQSVSIISYLKVRASYGVTGNAELSNFASRSLWGGVSYNGRPGVAPTQPGNNLLSWEENNQVDFGLEFGILDNKISGEIDYYNKQTVGLLFATPIIPSAGAASLNKNLGKMENKGIEIIMRSDVVKNSDLNWNVSVNAARNANKVLELPDGNDVISGRNILREGEAVNSFYLAEYAGVDPDNGDGLFYLNTVNPDGSIDRGTTTSRSAATRVVAGSPIPVWIGGLTNSVNYKNFEFSFTFQGEWGASIYNGGGLYQSANGDYFDNQTADQLNSWKQPGDKTNIPQARLYEGNGTGHSSRYLEKADFVRLRNITLGYRVPSSVLENTGFTNIRVYATAINLLTFTKYSGYDPEARSDAGGVGQAFYSAPAAKTFTFGVNMNF